MFVFVNYNDLVILPPEGRSMQLRPTLIEDFKTLVAEQGMSDDTIVIKKNKGILMTRTGAKHSFYFDLISLCLLFCTSRVIRGVCSRRAGHTGATDPGEVLAINTRHLI